jgi:hypothetical protein
VVLCHGFVAELLAECPVRSELGVLVEWERADVADRVIDRRVLRGRVGRVVAYYRVIVQETFLVVARVRDRIGRAEVVSDVMGYNGDQSESALGGYRRERAQD